MNTITKAIDQLPITKTASRVNSSASSLVSNIIDTSSPVMNHEGTEKQANNEARKLVRLFNILKKLQSNRPIQEDEYLLLIEYECVYSQGTLLEERKQKEIEWLTTKRTILEDAVGLLGFMKRTKLSTQIVQWFDEEYPKAFPDGDMCYGGYDCKQTILALNKQITKLQSEDCGQPITPLETTKARQWRKRLNELCANRHAYKKGNTDILGRTENNSFEIPNATIIAFYEILSYKQSGEGVEGFNYSDTNGSDSDDSDSSDGGSSDGGGGGGGD